MGLLGDFFLLPFDIYTVDFVVRELKKTGQKDAVMAFEMKKRLTVFKFSTAELEDIFNLQQSAQGNVSFQYFSIWFCAKKHSACILTGDMALTKNARADKIEVHGLLYVLDQLVQHGIVPPELIVEKLEILVEENKWLPEKIVAEFILKLRSLTSVNSL